MTQSSIPIWLDGGVDDIFVGKATVTESSIQMTVIPTDTLMVHLRGLIEAGKIRSFGLVVEYERADKPQTPEQLDYQKRVMGENYGS